MVIDVIGLILVVWYDAEICKRLSKGLLFGGLFGYCGIFTVGRKTDWSFKSKYHEKWLKKTWPGLSTAYTNMSIFDKHPYLLLTNV